MERQKTSVQRVASLAGVTMAHALLASSNVRSANLNRAATEKAPLLRQRARGKAWLVIESGTDGHDT